MRVAVDALNLHADRRGMGRLVRNLLRVLARDHALVLLLRDTADAAAIAFDLPAQIGAAPLADARRRGAFDAVWYPWNGIRFPAHAPAVVTVCDDFAFRFPARDPIARWREQRPIRRGIERAAALSTISGWSRDALAERFAVARERFTVLPLAPDPYFAPGPVRHAGRPFVLVVGGAEPRKRLGPFAATFARAFPSRDVDLVVVGATAAADRPALAQARAIVRGASDEELRELYRSACAVAVPSAAEGFGLVAVEAQACGAAVIAAAAAALPEAVGDAALLLPLDDEPAWIAALRRLAGDAGERARLGAAAARRWPLDGRDAAAATLAELLARLVHEAA